MGPNAASQGPDQPSNGGVIDYRLAREASLTAVKRGQVAAEDVCDATPELKRAAVEYSRPTLRECPLCDDADLVEVSYVFGPRLPAFGRCVNSEDELATYAKRKGAFSCYEIEVCPTCWWNHLLRAFPLGQ